MKTENIVENVENVDYRINPFPNKPWFSCVCSKSLENTMGKGEIACNEQFLLSPKCFLRI